MDLVIEEVDIIEVVCIVWELVIFNADCHGGGGGGGAAAASAAGGTWLGMLVLYLLGALRHVWPLS